MSQLNPAQQLAVQALDGPVLIIAGAGSGKTRVLTYRMAELLKQKKARPHEILAVTFTNKAAREMKERVVSMLGGPAEQLWVSTFHSSCVRILRAEIERLGYGADFVIYDDQDQRTLIKQCYKILNWDPANLNPRGIQAQINKAKNKGWTPEGYSKHLISTYEEKAHKIYSLYQSELKKSNAVDFGDLLALTVSLFQEHPEVLAKYQTRFKYCMVDEYQDTNHVQYKLIKLLCEAHQNICAVGDEDQSIYSWRGADISNILSFEKDFPQTNVIKLEQNYRSTQHIIKATSHLISNNRDRKPKTLWTDNDFGDPIQLVQLDDEYHEARYVAQVIGQLQEEASMTLSDMSVFYRTHAQSRILEDIFREQNIPHQIYGGMRFYGRAEVKDMMAYLKLVSNPSDSVSFLRVINTPARGIGKVTLNRIADEAHARGCSLYEGAKVLSTENALQRGTAKKLKGFISLMDGLIRKKKGLTFPDLYHDLLDQTKYVDKLKEIGTVEAQSKVENLEELDSAMTDYLARNPEATLETYLEEIMLISDLDKMEDTDEAIKLMTLHSAKGLEFPVVFMVGLEEGLFPHSQAEWDPSELEEERRLCYVGMTRAKKHLVLSYANARRVRGVPQISLPSRFIAEIPEAHVQKHDLRRRIQTPSRRHAWRTNDFSQSAESKQELPAHGVFDDDFNQDPLDDSLRTGMRIKHASFGAGVVCRVEGQKEQTKVTVKFDQGFIKKFLAAQAPIERL